MDSIPLKRCTKCLNEYPATTDYFHVLKSHSDGLHPHCKNCRNSYHRQFREVKPDPYDKEKDHLKYLKRRDAALEYRDRYYQSHKDEIKQYMSNFKKVHRERYNIYDDNREALKKAIPGSYTPAQIQDLLKRQRYKCYYCHLKFEKRKGKYIYHIDHTFPLSRVSSNIPANDISYLVLTCPTCNVKKNDKYPWEWPEGGRLL